MESNQQLQSTSRIVRYLILVILTVIGDYLIPEVIHNIHHFSAVAIGCIFNIVFIVTVIRSLEISKSSCAAGISSLIPTVLLISLINYFVGCPIDEIGYGTLLFNIIILNIMVLLVPFMYI